MHYNVTYTQLFMMPSRQQLDIIRHLVEQGKIKPSIDKSYPLEQTQQALAYSQQGRAKGKIINNIKEMMGSLNLVNAIIISL